MSLAMTSALQVADLGWQKKRFGRKYIFEEKEGGLVLQVHISM